MMKSPLQRTFDLELGEARAAFANSDMDTAFRHLERAHILSQRYTLEDNRSRSLHE